MDSGQSDEDAPRGDAVSLTTIGRGFGQAVSSRLTFGPPSTQVHDLETTLAALVGAPAALALNSPMAAFQTALLALDIGPGDGVVVSPLSGWNAMNAVEQVGARPVLVDVEPDTLTMDPARVAEALHQPAAADPPSMQLRAIAPTHYAGQPADLASLAGLALAEGLALVEDAAHAFSAWCQGQPIGRVGEAEGSHAVCFAAEAHPGEDAASGGFITGQEAVIARARLISHRGVRLVGYRLGRWTGLEGYDIVYPGFDFAMTDSLARLASQAIRTAARSQARRAVLAARYSAGFAGLAELQSPLVRPGVEPAWPVYTLRLNMDCLRLSEVGGRRAVFRDRFVQVLRERGVAARTPSRPMHLHPYYRDKYGYHPEDFPVAYGEYRRLVLLPLDAQMTDTEVDGVIEAVCDVARCYRR